MVIPPHSNTPKIEKLPEQILCLTFIPFSPYRDGNDIFSQALGSRMNGISSTRPHNQSENKFGVESEWVITILAHPYMTKSIKVSIFLKPSLDFFKA